MTFEVPSYLVLFAVITFGSLQTVTVWQLKVLMDDFRDYKNKLSHFREECEQRLADLEINCAKHHG